MLTSDKNDDTKSIIFDYLSNNKLSGSQIRY